MAVTQGLWNIGSVNVPDLGISEGGGGVLGQVVRTLIPSITQAPSNSLQYNSDKLVVPPTNTGSAEGSWGSSQPVPTSTPKITTPTNNPNPQPQQQSDSEMMQLLKMAQDGSINPSQRSRLAELLGGQSQQPAGPDWNAIYEPQLKALDEAGNVAQQSATLQEQNLKTQGNAQKLALTDQEALANTTYQTTEDKAARNLQSALQEARAAYLSMNQNRISRYGAASSTSDALGEIAQQQYFKETGKTSQSYADIMNDISTQWNTTLKEIGRAKMGVDSWIDENTNDVRTWLADSLQSIKMAKAQTESEKSAQKAQVLDRAQQAMQTISAYKQQAQIQIDNWKEQQRYLLENKLTPTYNGSTSGYNPAGYQPLANNNAQSTLPSIRYNPATARWEDEFGKAINQ